MRLFLLLMAFACQTPDINPDPVLSLDPLPVDSLSDTRLLRRTSLDLRGVLPSLEELERVESDSEALNELRLEMLEDDLFEERLVQVFANRWHTRIDDFNATWYDYFLDQTQEYEFERAIGEEPLRIMAHVAATDQAWSSIVTAETTMANELLASIWPIEGYPEDGEGWHPVHYTDDRPAVGVLASNGLWWRYYTTFFNQNRSRAAAISRLLLCEDLLNRPINFSASVSPLGSEDVTEVVLTEPACQGCHVTIEPLAAMLFGFWWMNDNSAYEMQTYHPEREVLGSIELGVEPNYYGVPVAGFGDLGHAIAADERFSRCAVKSMTEALWHRPVELRDFLAVDQMHGRFVDNDMQMKSLILELVQSVEYTAGGLQDEADDSTADRVRTARILDASLIRSLSRNLTGMRWESNGFDLLDNDEHGYRILAGGVDGEYVSTVQSDPGMTWALVIRRIAQGMASQVVQHDLLDEKQPPILLQTHLDARPSDVEFEEALATAYFVLIGERPTGEGLAGLVVLWEEVESISDASVAWQAVLSALMQDPDFVVY